MENIERTELRQLADKLQLGEYPEAMESLYAELKENNVPACDTQLIDMLQEKYNLFGNYFADVRKSAEEINNDVLRSMWVRTAVKFVLAAHHDEAYKLPAPPQDGTLATDYLMLHILIPQIPGAIEEYLRRGFSWDEIKESLKSYSGCIYMVGVLTGRPGINKLYYGWLTHYTKARIFKTNGLNFELKKLPPTAIWLRNRQTRQVVPVMLLGTFHASGIQRLGSVGYENEDGAFRVEFSEDEQNYYGHGTYNGKVSAQRETFAKSQWECVGRPGDGCLNVHIPNESGIRLVFADILDQPGNIVTICRANRRVLSTLLDKDHIPILVHNSVEHRSALGLRPTAGSTLSILIAGSIIFCIVHMLCQGAAAGVQARNDHLSEALAHSNLVKIFGGI